jgi:hypothetical protein
VPAPTRVWCKEKDDFVDESAIGHSIKRGPAASSQPL